ncbi:Metacaspase-1 (PfMCA1) [Cleaved into: Large subunit p20, partial [Durusdinium trenchii]
VPVAGPGSVLFFRYQLFIIVWALVIAGLWVAFVSSTDGSLYALGTENPQSPRELCAVIHRGYEQQRSLMSTKAYFLATAYVTSFVLCVGFGILQQRAFHRLNLHATHADFVAYVDGLPPISGSENLEEILKTELQTALSQDVVGVSVGWDFAQHSDRILEILAEDVMALEPASKADGADEGAAGPQSSARWKWFQGMDKLMLTQVLGIDLTEHSKIPAAPEALSAESISKSLVASPAALVVFKTESGRDAAVNSKKKISFRGSTLQAQALESEPMGICWQNLAIPRKKKRERIWAAIKMILLASFAWSVLIYMPFAQYTSSFSYSNGDKPSVAVTMSLTIIVVLGNLVMYTTCAEAAGRVGFMLRDSQEGTYMVLYTFSILVNILLDAALTGSIAYRTAVAQRARTYGGTLIADLTRAQAIFESFEIQRQLGLAVFKYCWPAMFLIPFVGEAVGANCFTLHLARLVVLSFSHIKGFRAQQALKILVPMDSGRYADVLINITAAVLIFFLPGGYTLPLFIALALSRVFIIRFDHYRVLRCVPSFCFCSSVVDDYGQMLLILPCALTLAAFVLKANCTVSSSFCVQDTSLGLSMLLAFTLHVAVHCKSGLIRVPQAFARFRSVDRREINVFLRRSAQGGQGKVFPFCSWLVDGGCRQEARQRIEHMQQALEAASTKRSSQMEAVTSRLHRVTSMEQELIAAKQELQGAVAAANKLRVSVARTTAENVNKEEALLQRFVQMKSELEEHQELSKQQEQKQKVLFDKLNETQQQRPKTRVQAEHAKAKGAELRKIAAELRASLDAAKEAADAEALRASEMEKNLEQQRKDLQELAEEAARQEVIAAAMKTALSEQRAMHQDCVKAQKGQSTSTKEQELQVEEQVRELLAKRAELAIKQEAVAAACSVEKERLTELRNEFEEVRTATSKKIEDASKESTEAEKNVQALHQEQRSLQEEYRVVMDDMKSQVSKGNDHYSKLQELEEDIRTFDDESELLTLGLHDAEHRKTFLLQEHELLRKTSGNFHPNLLQQWAKEVLGLRVAAQVKSYEDELEHWKQAASEGQPEAPPNGSSHQKAAKELLRQKAVALEEQLAAKEKQLKEFEKQTQHEEVPGNIRSVPSALHGSLFLGPTLSKMEAVQRRALVIGCNYCSSFAPLQGCANDAWNIQCLLRQSLQYPESQVRSLIDFSDSTASPPKRRPTRENIIAELQWLTQSAKPGDNVLFYFSGYGAQQPESQTDGLYEGHLAPMDFADNFPEDIVHELRHCNTSADSRLSPDSAQRAVQAGGYRLVPMSLITSALHSLPPTCKVTILLDCCQSSVVPLLRHSEARSLGPGPGPPLFKRLAPNVQEIPADAVSSAKIRLLNLPPLPGGHGLARQMVSPSSSPSSRSSTHASPHHMSSPVSEAQPSPLEATQRHGNVARGGPSCKCYSFATCQNDQVCCELPIEGCVQGAGTWAFVKAVAACHFSVSLAQHSKATDSILQNLRRKYRWIQQTPVIQLSASANVEEGPATCSASVL